MRSKADIVDDWRDFGVESIVRFWKSCTPESFREAQGEFTQLVNPYVSQVDSPRLQDIEITNMVFTEWLAYDFRTSSGLTPLELYVEALVEKGCHQTSASLAQIACSQFFSEFWVVWQRPEEHLSLIEDAFTGRSYLLCDEVVAKNPHWLDGLLSLRVACVDDEWHSVGAAPMHDNYPCRADYIDNEERLLREHPEGVVAGASGRGISYLAFARLLLGPDGGYLPSVEIHHLQ